MSQVAEFQKDIGDVVGHAVKNAQKLSDIGKGMFQVAGPSSFLSHTLARTNSKLNRKNMSREGDMVSSVLSLLGVNSGFPSVMGDLTQDFSNFIDVFPKRSRMIIEGSSNLVFGKNSSAAKLVSDVHRKYLEQAYAMANYWSEYAIAR